MLDTVNFQIPTISRHVIIGTLIFTNSGGISETDTIYTIITSNRTDENFTIGKASLTYNAEQEQFEGSEVEGGAEYMNSTSDNYKIFLTTNKAFYDSASNSIYNYSDEQIESYIKTNGGGYYCYSQYGFTLASTDVDLATVSATYIEKSITYGIYYNGKESTPKLNGVDLSKVMHNGKQIWPEIVTEIALADTKAGDVLLWDKINQKKLFTSSDNLSSYPAESYTPIGVVVVPASHNVYGDGSCGVMSLKPMNCDTPSTGGTSEQNMYWGIYGTNISTLPDLTLVPMGNTENGIPIDSASYGYLPSDRFSGTQCIHDTDAYYSTPPYSLSPYLTDGSRNPGYYQTSPPSTSGNALADFDGIGNTEKIIAQRGTKDYNSWKPTYSSESDYPAASCCDMFYTDGTQQGDWYLPACGELGYIMPPFNKINEAITNMRNAYGSSVGVTLDTNGGYWSSSECNGNSARSVSTYNGSVDYGYKSYGYYVRAFLKVSPLDLS